MFLRLVRCVRWPRCAGLLRMFCFCKALSRARSSRLAASLPCLQQPLSLSAQSAATLSVSGSLMPFSKLCSVECHAFSAPLSFGRCLVYSFTVFSVDQEELLFLLVGSHSSSSVAPSSCTLPACAALPLSSLQSYSSFLCCFGSVTVSGFLNWKLSYWF